jgi:hypothetical protein
MAAAFLAHLPNRPSGHEVPPADPLDDEIPALRFRAQRGRRDRATKYHLAGLGKGHGRVVVDHPSTLTLFRCTYSSPPPSDHRTTSQSEFGAATTFPQRRAGDAVWL